MSSDQTTPTAALLETILEDEVRENGSAQIRRGLITEIRSTGEIIVADSEHPEALFTCDVLRTGETMPRYDTDTPVLIICTSIERRLGIVLGRVGKYNSAPQSSEADTRDHVVIEANETLRLKCGESSVDLRKDGKLMIRGKDVLTRAKRTNRIKGGSVGIN